MSAQCWQYAAQAKAPSAGSSDIALDELPALCPRRVAPEQLARPSPQPAHPELGADFD
jgi:hypothetical protein